MAIHHRSDKSLELAQMYNPCIRGWIIRMAKKFKRLAGNQVMRPTDLGQISDCGWPGASRNA
jgi:hypothetical protein